MSNRFGSGFPLSALCAAVAIVAAAPVMAQNTTSAIGGRVVTGAGAPVAGATVTIIHRESGSTNTLVTDAEGRYTARGLRVGGPYTVTVSKGSDRSSQDDVYLALAESLSFDMTLGGTVLQQVVVTGTAARNSKFDSSTMGAGTSISRQELDAFASVQRNLQDYARTDPRLAQTDKDRGEISAAGQNTRYNSLTIDGVRTNDTFGLEANGLPTIKQPISIDAIQAVQVNLSNYDVTQQGYTGANINAVTKSGTNDFKGSVYYVYRDANMAGDRYNRTTGTYSPPPPSKDETTGFTLGGPIIKDRLFFFASYEELSSSRNAPVFGPLGGSLINVGITPAQITAAQEAARTKYGIEIGSPDVPSDVKTIVKDTLLKLDWNISSAHRANLRYSKTQQSDPIFPFNNANGLSLSSHWYSTEKTIETLVGQWFADWTDSFSTELKVSKREYESAPLNNADLPQISLVYTGTAPAGTATGDRTLRFGTEESRSFNKLATNTTNAYFAGNLLVGDHEIKAGGDFERNEIFNAFVRNAKGVYTFRGADPLTGFVAGRPSSYTVQTPLLPGGSLQDGAADWTLSNLGLFLQDTWTVSKNLTLNAGLRIDMLSTDDKPLANAKAQARFGYDNTQTLDGEKLVQPRFGFNYAFDTASKRKTQLRGGVGLFQGNAASVWLTNPFQNTGVAIASFTCTDTGATACPPDLALNPNPNQQPRITGVPPAANVDFIAPGVSQPSVWKLNLAFDHELPWYGIVAGAELLHTQVKQSLYYKSLNLGAPTGTAPDGRELFWNAQGRNPACWNGGEAPITTGACAGANRAIARSGADANYGTVTLIDKTSKGGGNAVTLSLSSGPRSAFGWSVAYTRTSAKEVSPLTSSTAGSNFANRAVYNPNEEVAANSAYLIRDRVTASLNWSKAFIGQYRTSFGVFYEGREGKPYSWTFRNDMNGDGISGNDLLYVPKAQGSGEVSFIGAAGSNLTPAQAEEKFWSVVNAEYSLRHSKGRVVDRNGAFSKFANSFDVRISQELPGLIGKNKGVLTLDILNFGNLVNKRWGRIDEIAFRDQNGANTRPFVRYAGIDASGKTIYAVDDAGDYTTRQNRGESQWAMQVTARYEF